MKVLHVSPSFYPATVFGGPIFSTYALCNALAALPEVEVRVLTTDTAGTRFGDRLPIKDFPMRLPAGYEVYYCGRMFGVDISPSLLARLWKMIRWADVIHLTAVYSSPTIPTLAICKMLKKPLVWSPRGALQRFNTSTRTKAKTLWERVCNSLCDEDRVILHVTSDEEKQESCARIPRAGTAVIPNGVEIPGTNGNRVALAGQELRLLYLGRLHPKKGIENLLRALSKLNLNPLLSICGDGDVGYRRSLEALVAELGLGKTVKFRGLVDGEVKEQQFQEADVCVVPSYSENFCLVVAEALARGVPVIASRSTPWAQVEDIGCGMWVDNDSKSLADAIVRMSAMPRQEMGRKGKDWMARSFAWSAIGQEMLSAYERLCR